MKIAKSSIWLVVALMISFLVVPVTQAAIVSRDLTPFVTATGTSTLGGGATDGKTVVWIEGGTLYDHNNQIKAASLIEKKPFAVTSGPNQRIGLAIDGNWIVWQENGPGTQEVHAFNLATKQELTVGEGVQPSISSNQVVWYGSPMPDNRRSLMVRDLSTMTPALSLYKLAGPPSDQPNRPVIEGNRVVWVEQVSVPGCQWQLFTLEIGVNNNSPTLLDKSDSGRCVTGYDLRSNILVYDGNPGVKLINLGTGERRIINNAETSSGRNPTTDGRYVFWEDFMGSGQFYLGFLVNIRGYDITTNSIFRVTNNQANNTYSFGPNLRNGTLVWSSGGGDTKSFSTNELFVVNLADVLPTIPTAALPVPPPSLPSSDIAFFSQTEHTLSFGFKYFWGHSGSLPVLGYPQTEEFSEKNPDDGKTYTVQYFERQRFEYHTEFKGTPYETELGRLGNADAMQKNLTGTPDFNPKTASLQAGCQFSNQTSHNICGSFLTYWQGHGLEFGDPGTSYRESLALFGYPISEQFKDPATGLTIQYFERAVFEYHSDLVGTPNEIELRLLGDQLLQSRGWR